MSRDRERAFVDGTRKRIDRFIPHADGWGAFQLRESWRCRDCSRLLGRDQLAWYLYDIGPYCTRCRNVHYTRNGDGNV